MSESTRPQNEPVFINAPAPSVLLVAPPLERDVPAGFEPSLFAGGGGGVAKLGSFRRFAMPDVCP